MLQCDSSFRPSSFQMQLDSSTHSLSGVPLPHAHTSPLLSRSFNIYLHIIHGLSFFVAIFHACIRSLVACVVNWVRSLFTSSAIPLHTHAADEMCLFVCATDKSTIMMLFASENSSHTRAQLWCNLWEV